MSLFTIVLDFKGGTYISQVIDDNVNSALQKWALNLDVKAIKNIGEKIKDLIIQNIINNTEAALPIVLDGCINVWCTSMLVRGHLILVHIINTVQD